VVNVRKALHIRPERWESNGDVVSRNATIEIPGVGRRRLYFEVPASLQHIVTDTADPFLLAALFTAMRRARRVHVHGRVSPSLLTHLRTFTRFWQTWHPRRYRTLDIRATDEAEDEGGSSNEAAILSFSGGLDSCFSAWHHAGPHAPPETPHLEAALMVHGFDIPIEEKAPFALAAENSRHLVENLGLTFLTAKTNVRDLDDDWEDAHGAALAACLHLVRRRFAAGWIAGSHSTSTLRFPWGSNPKTDPLLGTRAFPVAYDAVAFSRMDKARGLADWSEGMRRVRVCWQGKTRNANCCTCVRCLGTALCFAAEGVRLPESLLPTGGPDRVIEALGRQPITKTACTRLGEMALRARENGIDAPWVEALEGLTRRHGISSVSTGTPHED